MTEPAPPPSPPPSPKLVRFVFPRNATPRQMAEAIRRLREQHRKG
jgi:hypothetical protein